MLIPRKCLPLVNFTLRVCKNLLRFFVRADADLRTFLLYSFYAVALLAAVVIIPDILETKAHGSVKTVRLEKILEYNMNNYRYFKFRSGKELELENIDELNQLPESNWDSVRETYTILQSIPNNPLLYNSLIRKCYNKTDIEKLSDIECRAEWLYHLQNSQIVEIIDMLGFVGGKTCAITVFFEDGRKGMFKPCGSSGESPENEIVCSHMDYGLGFNRVAPSISRNITLTEMSALVLKHSTSVLLSLESKLLIIEQLRNTCADNDVLYGTMIGWWREVGDSITIPKVKKYFDEPPNYEEIRNSYTSEYLANVSKNHFFFYLIGTLRSPGYNEYELSDGTLIALDLDRGTWEKPHFVDMSDLTACHLCKIYRSDYDKLVLAKPSLGLLVSSSLFYDPSKLIFRVHSINTLASRINQILECIQNCVEKYSESNVFIEDGGWVPEKR